jgi:hypothetical protein
MVGSLLLWSGVVGGRIARPTRFLIKGISEGRNLKAFVVLRNLRNSQRLPVTNHSVHLTSSLMANRLLFAVGLHIYATKHTSAR